VRESAVLTAELLEENAELFEFPTLPFLGPTIASVDSSVWRAHLAPVSRVGPFIRNLLDFGTLTYDVPNVDWSLDSSSVSVDASIDRDSLPDCPASFEDGQRMDLPTTAVARYSTIARIGNNAAKNIFIVMPGNRAAEEALESTSAGPVLFCFGAIPSGGHYMIAEHLAAEANLNPSRLEARLTENTLRVSLRKTLYVARAPTSLRADSETLEYSSRAVYTRGSARIEAWGRQFYRNQVNDFRIEECWDNDVVMWRKVEGADLIPPLEAQEPCSVSQEMMPVVTDDGSIIP